MIPGIDGGFATLSRCNFIFSCGCSNKRIHKFTSQTVHSKKLRNFVLKKMKGVDQDQSNWSVKCIQGHAP